MNRTPTQTACADAHSVSDRTLNRKITFHHTNTRGSRAHKLKVARIGVLKQVSSTCHVSFPSTSSLSPTSPLFPTFSPSHPSPVAHDPFLPCEDPRQSGGSTQIPSPTGYEPKLIEPEDLEPRRIELGLGRDGVQKG